MSASRMFLSMVLVAAALGIGSVLLFPECARACSCASGPVEKEYSWSEAVFAGEAVSVEGEGFEDRTVTFRVARVWKGPERETLEVRTAASEASCGYEFEEGGKYLVYAGDGLGVNYCGATREAYSLAEADLRALDVGQGPKPVEDLPDTGGARWLTAAAAMMVCGLGMAALTSLVGRRPRSG